MGPTWTCRRLQPFSKGEIGASLFFIKTGNAEEVSEWKYDNIRLTISHFHTDVWQESICNLQQQKNMYLDLNLFLVRQEVGKRKVLARGISLVVPHLPPCVSQQLSTTLLFAFYLSNKVLQKLHVSCIRQYAILEVYWPLRGPTSSWEATWKASWLCPSCHSVLRPYRMQNNMKQTSIIWPCAYLGHIWTVTTEFCAQVALSTSTCNIYSLPPCKKYSPQKRRKKG